jgi:hypothetical protein
VDATYFKENIKKKWSWDDYKNEEERDGGEEGS